MTDDAIVIVDEDGNEHEFPAGFDPKRAAGIVRQQTYKPGKLAQHALSGDAGGPEGIDPTQSQTSRIGRALEPLAHPQSLGDMASLLIPAGAGEAVSAIKGAVRGYMSAGKRALEGGTTLRRLPGRMLGELYKDATTAPVKAIEGFDRYAPNISPVNQNWRAWEPGPRTSFAEGASHIPASPAIAATDAIERLKAAGVPPWRIIALQNDPQALAQAVAKLGQ